MDGILRSETADGMRIDWDAPIPMSDGTILRGDVYRPIAEGRYPVIMSMGPYGKWLHFKQLYAASWDTLLREHPEVANGATLKYVSWETVDPERWVPDGYVVVRIDSRGAGRSPGVLEIHSPQETRDYAEAIEWAGVQPWSNGKVGLCGISYYAINQWRVAALQPPHLAAICPWEGNTDRYREASRHGGVPSSFIVGWFGRQILPVQHGRGERGIASQITEGWVSGPETLTDAELAANIVDARWDSANRPVIDDFYRDRTPDLSKITVPVLSAANWGGAGLHLRGNVEGFLGAASPEKRLEIHGGHHWSEFYTDYGLGLQKRFFGHHLKGEDTGWAAQPKVQLQVRHKDRFVQRHEDAWPIPRTAWTRMHLHSAAGTLASEPQADAAQVSFAAMGPGVSFLTAPFEAETEITGPAALKLAVSSSTDDADLFVILRLFSPSFDEVVFQGASDPHTPVAQGWLRASHRKLDPARSLPHRPYHAHDEVQPLTPGQVYPLDIEIWPTSIVVPKGYRLALSIRGCDYEYPNVDELPDAVGRGFRGCGPYVHPLNDTARPAARFDNQITLHLGGGQENVVLLPVIPAA